MTIRMKETTMPTHEEWQRYARRDPILAGMIRDGKPLTREVWLRKAFIFHEDGVPDPVPLETEEAMPPPFRKEYAEEEAARARARMDRIRRELADAYLTELMFGDEAEEEARDASSADEMARGGKL
jgi:hypothetical protein